MHDDEEEEEGEEGETNSTAVTESSHRATEHAFPCLWRAPDNSRNSTSSAHPLAIILPVALQAAETPMEQQDPLHPSEAVASEGNLDNDDDEDDEGDYDDDDDNDSSALDAKPRINPYREFEEDMVMTHSLSLMQYAQQKALQGSVKEEDEDGDKNGLSVSWKFAYYMSLRSARREKLTMQVLLEATWFVCFRDTGATHPITFRADNTIVIRPAVHTPCGNSRITSNVNAAATTPLPCQLVKGGAELVVHVFPPLRVQRRLGSTTSTVGGDAAVAASNAPSPQAWVRVRASTNEAALRAFLAEPDATLRRLHAEEVGHSEKREEEENAADQDSIATTTTTATATVAANAMPKPLLDDRLCGDWGWMIQSPFVKIFSVETPVPLYVHQLRRTYAPRPP
ncbi:hypothetical protein DQ04_04491010 [Trypanosoma grayi]|uniref:hypothetical protein n=1 Tax=Trypanosoma grayi TaxID=71804 RepID=UPI0004F47BD1|nr:hypothetical protein DQ04_04491010 [Trypanosoma grayi]KEG09883.1 hypothetical protein DQ04_04491010 [Trypanosoma grayi]